MVCIASKVYQKHYVVVVLGLNTCQVWGKCVYVCLKCFKIWRIRKSFSEVSSHVFEMWKENNTLRQKLFLFTYCEEFETSSTNFWDQNLSNHWDQKYESNWGRNDAKPMWWDFVIYFYHVFEFNKAKKVFCQYNKTNCQFRLKVRFQ